MSNYVSDHGLYGYSMLGDAASDVAVARAQAAAAASASGGPRARSEADRIREAEREIARAAAQRPPHRDLVEMRALLNRSGFNRLDGSAKRVWYSYFVHVAATTTGRVAEFAALSAAASRI